jgi:putative ABC transport system permease protein
LANVSTHWGVSLGRWVGIVEDVLQVSLTEKASPQIFIDFRQVPASEPLAGVGLYFGIRTDGERTSIASDARGIIHQLDRQLIVENVAPMDALVSNSIASPRLYAVLLGIFAAVAVLLAAIGIYGVMSYAVTQRTPEIGVRMALGASRAQVMRFVLRQSLVLTAAGLLVGLGGAAAVTRYLDQLLFGLTALDPATFVGVSLLFGIIAALAAFIPARRAVRVDPLIALRFE